MSPKRQPGGDGNDRPWLLAITAIPPWPIENGYSLRAAHLLEQLSEDWNISLLSPLPTDGHRPDPPEGIDWQIVEGVPATMALPWRGERRKLASRVEDSLEQQAYVGALLWSGTEFLNREVSDLPPAVGERIDCEALQSWRNRRQEDDVLGQLRILRRGVAMALYERRALRGLRGIVVTGQDDARAIQLITGHKKVSVVPNGVALPKLDEYPAEGKRPRVIFTGTMGYGPNIVAARYFAREIWPVVHEEIPESEFIIAGRSPSAQVRSLAEEDGISVHADVPDLTAEIRRAWMAVAPMRSGSGIKNKILEAWAAGRPVVLSELATNGLDLNGDPGRTMRQLVCRNRKEMIGTVVELLRDRSRRRRFGNLGRSLAEERHSWTAAGEHLSRFLADSLPGAFAEKGVEGSSPLPS